jgi:hypothetical protein
MARDEAGYMLNLFLGVGWQKYDHQLTTTALDQSLSFIRSFWLNFPLKPK